MHYDACPGGSPPQQRPGLRGRSRLEWGSAGAGLLQLSSSRHRMPQAISLSMGQGFVFILLLLVVVSNSVPLSSQRKRIRREDESSSGNTTVPIDACVLDNETYIRGQEVPSLGPCEKCVCEAPDVVCSMIKCQPNSGCRIIQQSGQCCPAYKCDCEYNGLVYNNGERLDKPEDPCQVCYCKGGEIMCTSITCYERDDCKPLYTAGQCCPKYDHCPVETSRSSGNSVRSVNTSLYSPKREMQPWPLTKPTNVLTSVGYDESSPSPNIYPQTIRIVEIVPTTPAPVNKPSEVSVIPRIKTNDHSESRESEENAKVLSSTTESSPDFSSSTSEIEHLRDTTPEITELVNNESTTAEAHTVASSSTLNPLAESVDPNALPDSYRFSTVYPNYYYTEGNLNTVEEDTTNIWNEPEGSGYELLTGGIYEEISTLRTLLNGDITTENIELLNNLSSSDVSSHEIKEDPHEEVSDFPNFELYTSTEPPIISEEFNHSNITVKNDCIECNITTQKESSTTSASSSEKESAESDENSSESSEEDINENMNATSHLKTEKNYNQSITLDLDSPLSKKNASSERLILPTNQSEETPSSFELFVSTITTSSFGLYDKTENDGSPASTDVEYSFASTEPSEIFLVSQTPDSETTFRQPTERKRSSVGYYRNLDGDISLKGEYPYGTKEQLPEKSYRANVEASTNPSLISFPPVLNVHTLDYSEMSPQMENKTTLNASSMAKVGIYHPTKPNELASYLTIVDDNNNASSVIDGTVPSHILLTPNDLKKLAEILIHEKIKPVNLEVSTEKIETDFAEIHKSSVTTSYGDSKSSTVSYRSFSENEKKENITKGIVSNNTTLSDIIEYLENEKETAPTLADTNENSAREGSVEMATSKEVTASQDEVVKNFVSTVSGNQKSIKDILEDDPNISRQIRIPENANQYAALLDDRDLKILENFFKKNMGIH